MGILNKERALTPSWDLLPPSIELVKRNIWSVLYLSFLPSLFMTVGIIMVGSDFPGSHIRMIPHVIVGWAILAVALLWYVLAYPGYLYMQVEAAKGNSPEPLESFTIGVRRWLPLTATFIVQWILITIGLIALIVPGLILIRAYFLAQFFVVDQKLGPLSALSASQKASKPVSFWIWGIIGVGIVISLFGGVFGLIPYVGSVLSAAVGYIYSFAAALRYNEIVNGINPLQFVPKKESGADVQ